MQIVIEIEKRTYELIKDKPDNIAEEIIANGTPLPKGHGDLVDAGEFDKLLREYGLHYEADTFIPMTNVVLKADKENDNG